MEKRLENFYKKQRRNEEKYKLSVRNRAINCIINNAKKRIAAEKKSLITK